MKIGIRSQDTGAKDPKELGARLDSFGLDCVQLVAYKTFTDVAYTAGAMTSEVALGIGAKLRRKHIALIGAYFNPVHSNTEKRTNCKRVFIDYINAARELGGYMVGSETGSYNDDKWTYHPDNRTDYALGIVKDTFNELAYYAAGKNVTVGIEGAAGHVCYNVAALNKVVRSIPCENVAVIFDLFNFLEADNAGDYLSILKDGIQTLGDRIRVFHLKDYVLENGAIRQVPPGQGLFNYKEIFRVVKESHSFADLVLEGTTGADIRPTIEFLRRTWNEV